MKILAPLDGTERSLSAIRQASAAFPYGKFTYLVVADVIPEDREELFEGVEDKIHVLHDAQDVRAKAWAIREGESLSASGNHAEAIISASEDFDVLVMHGMDKTMEEMARFSSLTKIVRHAKCAVFLANC